MHSQHLWSCVSHFDVFAFDEVAIVHVTNRVVRRCFLLGDDPFTGKNYDHRKLWIEEQLRRFAAAFGIDLLGFAIMSNHFHLILRSRPDVVTEWNDTEIARRWLMLCPIRRNKDHQPEEPNDKELNTLRNNAVKLAKVRQRLSDIAWWMRLLCQNIAQRANREDEQQGRFFQGRYRGVKLLDEQALLACAAYVDLNPIRAAMAKTLEDSDFTSAQRRIQTLQLTVDAVPKSIPLTNSIEQTTTVPDGHLAPIDLNERTGEIGPVLNQEGLRASDKGFLPISTAEYLQLLDWTARRLVQGKIGSTPAGLAPIFERLGISDETWCNLVGEFGRLFYNVAGRPQTIDNTVSRLTHQRFRLRTPARKLFAAAKI